MSGAFYPRVNSKLIRFLTDIFTTSIDEIDFDHLLKSDYHGLYHVSDILKTSYGNDYKDKIDDIIDKVNRIYANYKDAYSKLNYEDDECEANPWIQCRFGIAEAMLSCGLIRNYFFKIIDVVGGGTYNYVFNIEPNVEPALTDEYVLRVFRVPKIKYNDEDFKQIESFNKLYETIISSGKACHYLPKMLFSSYQLLESSLPPNIIQSRKYEGLSDGVLIWSVVVKCERLSEPEDVNKHGCDEYLFTMMDMIEYIHQIGYTMGDWKIYNMGWGKGMDDQEHFVLLDYDLDCPLDGNRWVHTHTIPSNLISEAIGNKGFTGDVKTKKINEAKDWYVLTKEMYSVIKSIIKNGGHEKYNKYLKENYLTPSYMFDYIKDNLETGTDLEDYLEKLKNKLNEYFDCAPFKKP